MIYIDQPVLTGFSYSKPMPAYTSPRRNHQIQLDSNNCPKGADRCGTFSTADRELTVASTPEAAISMWKTIQGFMGVFPQYSQKEFYFATESYGGHYGPVFCEYFEKQNEANIPNSTKIRLSALLVGNGWHDALIQYQSYYNYTVNPGNPYGVSIFPPHAEKQMLKDLYGAGGCVEQVTSCYTNPTNKTCSNADGFCSSNLQQIYEEYSKRDNYDVRQFDPSPFPPEYYQQYLNTEKVQHAIGAFVNFTDGSDVVSDAFAATGDDSRALTIRSDTRKLLERGVSIILYYGDADFLCNWIGGEVVAENLEVPGFEKAGYTNITTSDGIVHGQVRQIGTFAFVRVYDAGHMVPFFQPFLALEMLKRVIRKTDIASGLHNTVIGYITNGTIRSEYREGNKSVVWDVSKLRERRRER